VYLQFFGLSEPPFSITPDPAFVYLSAAHRDALAHLLYGVGKGGAGGFVQLTGEVGTGKTTLCRCLLEQVPPETRIALILNPLVTPKELLASICEELGIDAEPIRNSSKQLVDALNHYLLDQHAQGRRVVVVIDEAQNLSPEALEQVRLLTNLETAKHKLLQMVLLGQPELRQLLHRQSLRQLAQRITARYHLAPLSEKETMAYVRHRMQVAGASQNPFKRSALKALYQRSGGVPRLINIIADRALVGAYARESQQVNAGLVHAAANEVQPSEERVAHDRRPWLVAVLCSVLLAVLSVAIWGWPWQYIPGNSPQAVVDRSEPQSEPEVQSASSQAAPEGSNPASSVLTSPEPDETQPIALPGKANPLSTTAIAEISPSQSESSASLLTLDASGLQQTPGTRTQSATMAPTRSVSLDQNWLDLQHARAWASLARLWGRPGAADSISQSCSGEMATGFACVLDQGSWAKIGQLGLPVALVLHGESRRLVVLTGLLESSLILGTGEDERVVSRAEIEPQWLGEYFVAWPQAPEWPVQISRGETGKAVEIVMEMATLAEPPWEGNGGFDAQFEAWVKAFQRNNGLLPDGIIGPKTLLYLLAPTISEPRLNNNLVASS